MEEICLYDLCDKYEEFSKLVLTGMHPKEAFHKVVSETIEENIITLTNDLEEAYSCEDDDYIFKLGYNKGFDEGIEIGFEDGYTLGYKEGTVDVSLDMANILLEFADKVTDTLEDCEDECEHCDCVSCKRDEEIH